MSDDKSLLNQYCQKKHISGPRYQCEHVSDGYSCTLTVEEEQFNSLSTHSTKKDAEKDVARVAVQAILQHNSAKTFDNVLKSLSDLSVSGSTKKQNLSQFSQPTTTSTSLTNGLSPLTPATVGGSSPLTPATTGGPSPLIPAITGGRANVHYPLNTPSVAPPPGFPANPPRPPTHHPPYGNIGPPPLTNRVDLPISVNGPSIDHRTPSLNKPSSALPLPAVTTPTSSTSEPPPLISIGQPVRKEAPPRSDKDVQDLEYYCSMSGLPSPIYTIYRDNRGKQVGRVKIGEMEFGRGWGYDSFDDAKDSAAVVAIAGLALTQMRLARQGKLSAKGGSPPLSAVSLREAHTTCSPPTSPSATTQPPHSSLPTQPPHSSLPTQPPHSSLPTRPPHSSLPTQPPHSSLPTRPPHSSLPTQPPHSSLPPRPSPVSQPPHPLTNTLYPIPRVQRPLALSHSPPPLVTPSTHPQVLPLTQPSPFTHPHAPPTQISSLHTPAYFQQPIARGSSRPVQPESAQSTTSSGDPQTSAMAASGNPQTLSVATNYKGLLNTYCQKNHYPNPTYECDSPEDTAGYISTVTVNGVKYKSGVHGAKKAADADAARVAMEILGVVTEQEVDKTSVKLALPSVAYTTGPTTPALSAFVSYKNLLQEKAQKEKQSMPNYSTERAEEGFVSTVTVYLPSGQSFKETSSPSPVKKAAEQEAARLACQKLQIV